MTATGPSLDRPSFAAEDPARIARLNRLFDTVQQLEREDAEQLRYGAAALQPEAALCTPVDYQERDLSYIPERILSVDYGCGDPTRLAREGETVLDLGSGSGKHCFMIAKKVGPEGRVIGIDKTSDMLALSRGAVDEVTANLGYPAANVEFRCGQIENLAWNLDRMREHLASAPIDGYEALGKLEGVLHAEPLVASDSVDLVVSNCVLNLVEDSRKRQLFEELYRVLRRGGRAVISDIVADRDIPADMKADEHLWTGCVSGALRRDQFLQAFADVGFYGIQELSSSFWQEVGGVQFHSVTLVAYKGKDGPCWETYRQAYYVGPFSSVEDDDGHSYPRGVPVPVCEKTAKILSAEPYAGHFLVSEALTDEAEQIPFDCSVADGGRRELPDRPRPESGSGGLNSGAACGPGCC